ncbi:MAG: hypothetical protein KC416_08885, partial [Myxococcales bacterium]|nr:hypothetical protein [Myxococcales bacterium]
MEAVMRQLCSVWVLVPVVIGCSSAAGTNPTTGAETPVVVDGGGDSAVPVLDASKKPTQCTPPTHLVFETLPDGADIKVGWTGVSHGIGLPSGVQYATEVFDCDDACRECQFSGPVPVPGQIDPGRRCATDSTKRCANDDECGAGGCRTYYGAGIQTKVDSPPIKLDVCAMNMFEPLDAPIANGNRMDNSPLQGTIDLVSGTLEFTSFRLRSVQYLGVCNVCNGDATAADGKAEGTCTTGLPFQPPPKCDANSTLGDTAKLSLDCPYLVPLSDFPMQVAPLATRSLEWELEEGSPECGAAPGKKCWCGTCAHDSAMACHLDTDCGKDGDCIPAGAMKPSSCAKFEWGVGHKTDVCKVKDTERNVGICEGRIPSDAAFLRENTSCFGGEGQLGATIRVFGQAQPFKDGETTMQLGSLTCFPKTTNETVNSTAGFPGVGALELATKVVVIGGDESAE